MNIDSIQRMRAMVAAAEAAEAEAGEAEAGEAEAGELSGVYGAAPIDIISELRKFVDSVA